MSPLNVLMRGYSLTQTPDGTVVRSASAVRVGDGVQPVGDCEDGAVLERRPDGGLAGGGGGKGGVSSL